MRFEQLIEEMKKHSGLSNYYFEMLKSIGWDWEDFLKKWYEYTLTPEEDKKWKVKAADSLIRKTRALGKRLGYIFERIREADTSY